MNKLIKYCVIYYFIVCLKYKIILRYVFTVINKWNLIQRKKETEVEIKSKKKKSQHPTRMKPVYLLKQVMAADVHW